MKKYTKAIQEVVIIPQTAGTIVTACEGVESCAEWECTSVYPCTPYNGNCYSVYDCTDEYSGTRCVKFYPEKGCGDYSYCFPGACYYYCG